MHLYRRNNSSYIKYGSFTLNEWSLRGAFNTFTTLVLLPSDTRPFSKHHTSSWSLSWSKMTKKKPVTRRKRLTTSEDFHSFIHSFIAFNINCIHTFIAFIRSLISFIHLLHSFIHCWYGVEWRSLRGVLPRGRSCYVIMRHLSVIAEFICALKFLEGPVTNKLRI